MKTHITFLRPLAAISAWGTIPVPPRCWCLAVLLLLLGTPLRAQEYAYQYQIGAETLGGIPQFFNPTSMAVDGSGYIYVADNRNNRIVKLNPDGTIALILGRLGNGAGQFNQPFGVAVDGLGNLYVADQVNHRIQKFDPQGHFLLKFGSEGSGDGQFSYPVGVAVDGLGNIYVVDEGNHRFQKFDPQGHFLLKFGGYGSGEGQFQFPYGVAVDGLGNVYASDQGKHRIQVFNPSGKFLSQFGSEGSNDGQLQNPFGVAVDGLGNVYVADYGNHRIQKFDSQGHFLLKFGGEGQFKGLTGVAVDGLGNVYVTDGDNHIQKFNPSGGFLAKFGANGNGDGQFRTPYGVAVDGSSNVYVSEQGNHRIQKFNPNGTFVSKFGSEGSGEGQFNTPDGVAVDELGHLYVADQGNQRIQKYNPNGTFVSQFGSEGSGEGQFDQPLGVAVDGSGNVYVADAGNHRIQKFDPSGSFLLQFGGYGGGEGQFRTPSGVAVDGLGNVYVADRENNRIQKFDPSGSFLLQFGGHYGGEGSGDGQFNEPFGVAVDGSGQVYVADYENHRIQKFTSSGTFISQFGQGQLVYPSGVAVDSRGQVYVASSGNDRIDVFAPVGCRASGSILQEVWSNVSGNYIRDIPLNTAPTFTDQLTVFRTQANVADAYGQRIRGYLCPPGSGNYTFFLQGDDQAELYLSTDEDPANKQRIASATLNWSWNEQASQQSAPRTLVAGHRYYIEVLHKEGSGGDVVRVGWRTPQMATDAEPVIIPGAVLSPFEPAENCTATGSILREVWMDVPGRGTNEIPLNTTPTFSEQLTSLRSPGNIADFYGQRIRGYLCLPSSGNYTFFIQGDDQAELYLSSDSDPLHKQRIASATVAWSWHEQASQQSALIRLVAGKSYYLEVLHKEGSGGDVVRVGWRTPQMDADAEPSIIPGAVLSPFVMAGTSDTRQARVGELAGETLADALTVSPNPFSEQAMIHFSTATTAQVRLEVYDTQGRVVSQLFDGLSTAREVHQLSFDGRRLSQGLYLVKLATSRGVVHQKLLLTR